MGMDDLPTWGWTTCLKGDAYRGEIKAEVKKDEIENLVPSRGPSHPQLIY